MLYILSYTLEMKFTMFFSLDGVLISCLHLLDLNLFITKQGLLFSRFLHNEVTHLFFHLVQCNNYTNY